MIIAWLFPMTCLGFGEMGLKGILPSIPQVSSVKCCTEKCELLEPWEWQADGTQLQVCRKGCEYREHKDSFKSNDCQQYCTGAAAEYSNQDNCEAICVKQLHSSSSGPAHTSVAACVSDCTKDLPRQRLQLRDNCLLGCQTNFDKCTCGAGQYPTLYGCQDCPPGTYCEAPFVNIKLCPAGRYGQSSKLSTEDCSGECMVGHFCPEGSTNVAEKPCPAGTYGGRRGLGDDLCSGHCAHGHYCPEGSISAYQVPCPPGTFGSAQGLENKQCSGECPYGHFCLAGAVRPTVCPSGRFGSSMGLVDADCSGPCPAGHFCPPGSKFPQPCSSSAYGENREFSSAEAYQCTVSMDS